MHKFCFNKCIQEDNKNYAQLIIVVETKKSSLFDFEYANVLIRCNRFEKMKIRYPCNAQFNESFLLSSTTLITFLKQKSVFHAFSIDNSCLPLAKDLNFSAFKNVIFSVIR